MRQFDLQRAFLGARALAEDFENETGAVDDLGVPGFLQIALLHRRKRAVHGHERDLLRLDDRADLLDLALAEIGRGPHLVQRNQDFAAHVEIDRLR